VALESGDNRAVSLLNHANVVVWSAACIFIGRAAFRRLRCGDAAGAPRL
jgi:hypothetical protein